MKVSPEKLASLLTEQRNPKSMNIDLLSTREILQLMHEDNFNAFKAIEPELERIEQAIDMIVAAFQNHGRLIYVGAGTSGRLGVLDASECPPTFGCDLEMVQGIISGGWLALRRSVEHAEDFPENGAKEIAERNVSNNDVVAGIAASSTTPFVSGALHEAHSRGAKTIFITCHPNQDSISIADVTITLVVGPELLTGSTRLKAGTATKLTLNMLTTVSMIRIGKVYQNLMVDLNVTCNKLENRARRILNTLCEISYEEADQLIQDAGGRVKTALVMYFCEVSREEAEKLIERRQGRIQDIIPTEIRQAPSATAP